MDTSKTFHQNPWRDGLAWTVKFLVLATVVLAGWLSGHLQATCVTAIVVFVAVQGVIPFVRLTTDLVNDCNKCLEEKRALQQFGVDQADRLVEVDASNSGSIFQLIVGIKRCEERMSKTQAAGLFLNVAREHWEKKLIPTDNAAEQAPLLGLGGSLLGILGSLALLQEGGGGAEGLYASMATMISTTLAGCGGALLLTGLAAIARNAVNRHLSELEMIASLMVGSSTRDKADDDFQSLF